MNQRIDDLRSDDMHPTSADFGWTTPSEVRERRLVAQESYEPYLRAHGLDWLVEHSDDEEQRPGRDVTH